MMLRPMANLFAVSDPDPGSLGRIEQALRDAGDFAKVWRPATDWLAASAPLPDGEPDDEVVHERGFAFGEGRDRLDQGTGHDWLGQVADLADQRPADLARLPGDFAFLRFRADRSALAVRSCGGWVPLYVRKYPRGVAIGTRLAYFTRFLPERFAIDPLVAASFTATGMLIDGRTFLEGVSIIPRGGYAELAADRAPLIASYWDPRPESDDEIVPSPEHAVRLRELLIETLERDLDPGGRNLLTLSGGIDSSALGALAAGALGRRLSSFSVIPSREPERSYELSYIDPLTEAFGIQPARKLEATDDALLRWHVTGPGLPFQITHPALCELSQICAEQEVRVMVGGEFADEVCGHLARITDWVRTTPASALLRPPSRLPFGNRDRLRWIKRRALDAVRRPDLPFVDRLDVWVHPEVGTQYRESMERLQRRSGSRPFAELAVHAAADGWVAMNWEGASPLGVRRSIPFFTRECLELAYRCHPHELLGPGPKRLLRDALRNDVPAHNLQRPDKGEGNGRVRERRLGVDEDLPEAARPVVRPDWHPRPPGQVPRQSAIALRRLARLGRYVEGGAEVDS